jgi:predicted RNA binding protein YcfA (HicA-like mRNA interferase family)
LKYRQFIQILEVQGFTQVRQVGSHRQFEGHHSGRRWMVTVGYRQLSDDVLPKNFASMIRQSGLSKKLFR